MSPDVIVIGAGAIGTSIAYQLSRAGLKVMIFDRGSVGGQSTGASAGMVMVDRDRTTPEPFVVLGRESARLYPALVEELEDRTGIDIGYRTTGALHVALDDAEARNLRERRGWAADHGEVAPWLDPVSARDIEPALSPSIHGAILLADAHHLMSRHLSQALARAAVDLGAQLREGAAVDRLMFNGDRVTGVAIGGETVSAGEVVIAGGAWSAAWSHQLRASIPVRPVRGQIVALRTDGTSLRKVVYSSEGYALNKPDGFTYVGTTLEEAGFDARPTLGGVADLLALAPRLAPRLADATVDRAWAGLRPATPDGLPLMGRVPGWQGVTLATGHFRNGILLAPITGELVADLLLRRQPRLPLTAFDPQRFKVRAA